MNNSEIGAEYPTLARVSSPSDLKAMDRAEIDALASEIREFLVREVAKTGGHLGPNLGVIETTIAMHRVFDSPKDSLIFDTGHQAYVHKILTGRTDFELLRQRGGLAGYPQRSESVHDIVESSHASSSLSWADGISKAYQLGGERDRHVVVLVGDGALTGGMTWEALNNISDDNNRRLVIVVNDNGRSYAPTIGGMARYLNSVRTKRVYRKAYVSSRRFFFSLGKPGQALFTSVRGALHGFQRRLSGENALYSNLDLKYIGPIDGHDTAAMEEALQQAKHYGHPVIVHAITEKGKGYQPALSDTVDQFHAVGKIDPDTGEPISTSTEVTWTAVFSRELVRQARHNPKLVGITAAMPIPVGMDEMAQLFPERVFDVGIAEQHAATSAAGMAFAGLHPVVAIYATFMNRAFDQVLMDVALHKAGVTFVLDRSGVTGPDGPSHNGTWDLAMLQIVPGIRLAAPRDAITLAEEFAEAVTVDDGPTVIRYPKGRVTAEIAAERRTHDGVDVLVEAGHRDVLIVAVGAMAGMALDVATKLDKQGIGATVVDPRWVVPVAASVVQMAADYRLVVSIEDGIRVGGIGTRIRQDIRAAGVDTPLTELGLPDQFLDHASRDELLAENGLTARQITLDIMDMVLGTKLPKARPLPEDTLDPEPRTRPAGHYSSE